MQTFVYFKAPCAGFPYISLHLLRFWFRRGMPRQIKREPSEILGQSRCCVPTTPPTMGSRREARCHCALREKAPPSRLASQKTCQILSCSSCRSRAARLCGAPGAEGASGETLSEGESARASRIGLVSRLRPGARPCGCRASLARRVALLSLVSSSLPFALSCRGVRCVSLSAGAHCGQIFLQLY